MIMYDMIARYVIPACNNSVGVSISLGVLLSLFAFVISTSIHELAHFNCTIKYIKLDNLQYCCGIRLGIPPRTESDYYSYLESRKYVLKYQNIIRKISIVGYKYDFIILFIFYILSLWFHKWLVYNFVSPLILLVTVVNVLMFIVSSDLKYYLKPEYFVYKYKNVCKCKTTKTCIYERKRKCIFKYKLKHKCISKYNCKCKFMCRHKCKCKSH